MKITRRDLGVIMILAGILVIFLAYKMSFEPTQAEIEQLQADQKALQEEIDALQPIVDAAPEYEKKTKEYQKNVDKMLEEFPANVWQEDNIMYVEELRDNLNIKVPSFSSTPAQSTQEVTGAGALKDKVYRLLTAKINLVYKSETYDDMKEMVDYFYSDSENKRTLDSINMSFDKESGVISGSANLTQYVMTDGTKEYDEVELPLDNLGIESGCIFGEVDKEQKK